MKTLKMLSCLSVVVMVAGCGGFVEKEEHQALSQRVDELRSSLDETRSRIDEMNNKFTLLREKIDAEHARAEKERMEARAQAASAMQAIVPDGLKVVKLDEKEPSIEAKAKQSIKQEAVEKTEVKDDKAATTPRSGAEGLYNKGYDLFMASKYKEARKVFADLVKRHPDSHLADNALYWIGESYYTERSFDKAIQKFKEVVEKYPGENKAPDALLKEGLSYLELHKLEQAREALTDLLKRYPDSEAAPIAQKTLDRLSR